MESPLRLRGLACFRLGPDPAGPGLARALAELALHLSSADRRASGSAQLSYLNLLNSLQALNYMARGMGLPPLPPHGHPLAGHPGVNGAPHLPGPHHVLTSSASGVIGRPTSTPSTGTNAFNGKFVFSTLSKVRGHHTRKRPENYFPRTIWEAYRPPTII